LTTIEQLNQIAVAEILGALQIKFSKKWSTFSLYEGNKSTGGWKASIDWEFKDFSNKWRPEGDRLKFIQTYLGVSTHEALTWVEETFWINGSKWENKTRGSPLTEKRNKFKPLNEEQIKYLDTRGIYKYDWCRSYKNNICIQICTALENITSLQSRNIGEWNRYYVEANTNSDGLFIHKLDYSKKALIVVEWMTDFLSLRQYTTNVVGLVNAKNDGQLQMIKNLSNEFEIYFVPDNDDAGKITIQKFNVLWIHYNLFKLEPYWMKDINDVLVNYWLWEEILTIIFNESDKPLTNLQLARKKALEYRILYEENDWHLGFPSWYEVLDKYTDWIIRWKVYMIMAYSNVGKTRFAYSLVKSMVKLKKKIHFYSLEVDAWMLFLEIIQSIYWRDRGKTMENLNDLDLTKLEKYLEIHDDVRSLNKIVQSIKNEKPEIAFIDFVQNIEEKGWEYEKMTNIALTLQKLAIFTGTTIFPLSQVANEGRFAWGDALPKWSWALFASSDVIFTLWAKDWEKYLTISKNKYWKANVNYILNIDYQTSTFRMAEDNLEEAWGFKWLK